MDAAVFDSPSMEVSGDSECYEYSAACFHLPVTISQDSRTTNQL
jgi:hypothetical protein